MPRSGSLTTRSMADAYVRKTSGEASVEAPSTTMYSFAEKPCETTLAIVLSRPAALLKLIVTIVKSGSIRAIQAPARALPPDDDERRRRHRYLAGDLGGVAQELREIERQKISWHHDRRTWRNDIRIVECQPIFRDGA